MSHDPGSGQHVDLNWMGNPRGRISELERQVKFMQNELKASNTERDKYRAIALNLIRVYRVDDQAWAPDEEAEKMLEKEAGK